MNKKNNLLTRFFDIVLSILFLIIGSPLFLIVVLILYFESPSPIYFQQRLGKNKKTFIMFKFRTMRIDTKSIDTHLVEINAITRFGKILRHTKLDEMPQIFNVLIGDMSFVGPRPCLLIQKEVIKERDSRHIFDSLPGITGLAQILRIDMSTPILLAQTDLKMLAEMSIKNYFKYIFYTVIGKGFGDQVREKIN